MHVLNHVLKRFVINLTINCFNEVNNKCNMKFIHKNNLFSSRKIAPRSGSGFGLRLALELGLGGGQFSWGGIFLEPIYIGLQLFWQDTKHSLKLTLLSILLFVVLFSKIIYEEMLRQGYTVKYFFQSISSNTYFTIVSSCKLPRNIHDILFEVLHEISKFWKSIFRILSIVKDFPIEFVFMLD